MVIEIKMPALSPTMTSGTLLKWHKSIGDKVKSGEVLMEIETDKSTMEYESAESGVLAKIFIPDNTKNVKVNELVCIFAESGEDYTKLEDYASSASVVAQEKQVQVEEAPIKSIPIIDLPKIEANNRIKISPYAKRFATENHINTSNIKGSGPEGRIVKIDILNSMSVSTPVEIVKNTQLPISGMRKVIAERLTYSKTHIPHFYLTRSCMMDSLLSLRETINKANPEMKITINDIITKSIAYALAKSPEMNRSWDDAGFINQYSDVDISIAISIEDGLITPIVRKADQLSLVKISENIKDLASRAKSGKLKPSEYQGGSLTISNMGMFGVENFSAILNPPQACIIAIGGTQKKPIVINDEIKIASMMELTLSVDHRVIDGSTAAKFLNEIKSAIENPILFLVS